MLIFFYNIVADLPANMEHTTDTDESTITNRIIAHIQSGDRKSAAKEYAYLVNKYSASIIDFTSLMVSSRADAEELAQNTFVKAFNNIKNFEGRASFFTWIRRIAYNEAINLLKRKKIQFTNIDNVQMSGFDVADEELSTDNEERILQLEAAITNLPADERMLLRLYYYENKSIKEIAYIMNAEPNTLNVRLHRIRKKLVTMINPTPKDTPNARIFLSLLAAYFILEGF